MGACENEKQFEIDRCRSSATNAKAIASATSRIVRQPETM
jgi:hypothetical protein